MASKTLSANSRKEKKKVIYVTNLVRFKSVRISEARTKDVPHISAI